MALVAASGLGATEANVNRAAVAQTALSGGLGPAEELAIAAQADLVRFDAEEPRSEVLFCEVSVMSRFLLTSTDGFFLGSSSTTIRSHSAGVTNTPPASAEAQRIRARNKRTLTSAEA